MSSPFDFDRRLSAWLDEQAPMREPDGLTYTVLARTRRMRRLPGWAILERWLPMQTTYKFGAVPRTAIILVILAVLLAVAGAVTVAQQGPKLPPPIGPARNGLIAFDSSGDIWVTNLDGTGRRQLTTGPDVDQGPIFSPDGTHIAFWNKADTQGQSSLMVMDADGGHQQTLAAGLMLNRGGNAGLREPTWSHDGQRLAYPDRFDQGVSVDRISVVPLAGGVPLVLARTADGPTWSPDDAVIAYRGGGLEGSGQSSPVGVYLVDSTGGDPHALLTLPDDYNPASYIYPQWSPDGARLAVSGGNPFVYVTSVESPSWQAIGQEFGFAVLPVWSPDGSRIAFERQVADNRMQVVVADADGSNRTELVHPPLIDKFVTWSPDGTALVGYLPDGSGMLVLDPTGIAQPLTISAPGEVGYSSWQRLAE